MNKRDRDRERRRDGDREGVWAAPVGIPAGRKSGKDRWCLSGRLSSVPGWRSGWTLQGGREETPDWKSEVWKGVREKALLDTWQMRDGETVCGEVYSGTPPTLWNVTQSLWKQFDILFCEGGSLRKSEKMMLSLALWIANYNIKPFVRNLSVEFYFKWMLRMTPLHSTLHIPSFSCLQIQDVWKGDRFWPSSPYYNTLLIIVSRGEKCRASQLKKCSQLAAKFYQRCL